MYKKRSHRFISCKGLFIGRFLEQILAVTLLAMLNTISNRLWNVLAFLVVVCSYFLDAIWLLFWGVAQTYVESGRRIRWEQKTNALCLRRIKSTWNHSEVPQWQCRSNLKLLLKSPLRRFGRCDCLDFFFQPTAMQNPESLQPTDAEVLNNLQNYNKHYINNEMAAETGNNLI